MECSLFISRAKSASRICHPILSILSSSHTHFTHTSCSHTSPLITFRVLAPLLHRTHTKKTKTSTITRKRASLAGVHTPKTRLPSHKTFHHSVSGGKMGGGAWPIEREVAGEKGDCLSLLQLGQGEADFNAERNGGVSNALWKTGLCSGLRSTTRSFKTNYFATPPGRSGNGIDADGELCSKSFNAVLL